MKEKVKNLKKKKVERKIMSEQDLEKITGGKLSACSIATIFSSPCISLKKHK